MSFILPPRFAEYVAHLGAEGTDPRLRVYPGLSSQPWHDPAGFPIASDLERNAHRIVAEFRGLRSNGFHRESERINREGNWDVAILFERGIRRDHICAASPTLTAVVDRNRAIKSLSGLVYFSRLGPMTRIKPHKGPTNLRLRCHLGIEVPDDCGLTVAGHTTTWHVGKCLIFDDFFQHEAWNASSTDRIVLVLDVWHPELSELEIRLLEGLQKYAYLHARNLARYWAVNDRARAVAQANLGLGEDT